MWWFEFFEQWIKFISLFGYLDLVCRLVTVSSHYIESRCPLQERIGSKQINIHFDCGLETKLGLQLIFTSNYSILCDRCVCVFRIRVLSLTLTQHFHRSSASASRCGVAEGHALLQHFHCIKPAARDWLTANELELTEKISDREAEPHQQQRQTQHILSASQTVQ